MKIITDEKQLRKISKPVEARDPSIDGLIVDMRATMLARQGCGLAAVQIGVFKRIFIFTDKDLKTRVMINPEIVYKNVMIEFMKESCLSIPDKEILVSRSRKIKVKFFDENGVEQEEEFKFPIANIILHEYDHLDGILITDK